MVWKTFPWRTLGLTWLEHTNFCKAASSDRLGILVLLVNSIYREMTNKGLSILLLYRRSRQGDVHRGNRHWCLKMGKVDVVRQVQYSPSKLNKTEPVVSAVHPNKRRIKITAVRTCFKEFEFSQKRLTIKKRRMILLNTSTHSETPLGCMTN